MSKLYSRLVSIIILFATACSSNAEHSKKLKINLVDSPTSLDPVLTRNLSSLFLARHLFEGLFRFENDQVVEALCQKMEHSQDYKTFRFYLKNATYSDGSSITAQDFIKTAQKVLEVGVPCDYVQLFYIVKNAQEIKEGKLDFSHLGMTELAPDCIEYTLNQSYPEFSSFLTHPIFFPKKEGVCNTAYSGPYVLKKHELKQKIVLEKNPYYHDKQAVILNEIEGVFVSNETAETMFLDKKLDFIGSPLGAISQDAIEKFRKEALLNKASFLATSFLRLNTHHPFLEKKENRLFLKELIQKAPIVEKALLNLHEKTQVFVPASLKLNTPIEASFLINSVSNQDVHLTLKYSMADARNQKIACLIKEVVETNSTLKIDLKPCESKTLLQDLSKNQFDFLLLSWIADYNDPENFLELFYDNKRITNGTGWQNTSYQTALTHAKTHPEKRNFYFSQAEQILLAESPIIPLFQFNMIYAKDKKLEDFSLNSFGILDFKRAHF